MQLTRQLKEKLRQPANQLWRMKKIGMKNCHFLLGKQPVAIPILPSQEDECKLMVDQDPHSRSVAGDSRHGTMAVTPEAEPVKGNR